MTTPKGFKLPDDKKLIQTAENLDDKKWLVNRFEVQMENMIREITTVRETFNSYATKAETEFKELRSISLAVVAIAAALILGISYDQIGITYPNIITAIVVVIIAGIGSFILLTFLKKKAHSIVMATKFYQC